jgi:hypothetical protein
VLPGAGICVQWHQGAAGWRLLKLDNPERRRVAREDVDRDDSAAIDAEPAWRPWTGDPASVAKVRIPRRREGEMERWWVLAGELPAPDSTAVVTVPDHSRPDVTIIEGRIWACEWSGSPSPAVISVDGGPELTVDFSRKGRPSDRSSAGPGNSGHGWFSYRRPQVGA